MIAEKRKRIFSFRFMARREKQICFQILQCLITARLVHKEATDAGSLSQPVLQQACSERSFASCSSTSNHETCSEKSKAYTRQRLTQTLLLYSFRALARHACIHSHIHRYMSLQAAHLIRMAYYDSCRHTEH